MGRRFLITVLTITICVIGLAFAVSAADKEKPDGPRVVRGQPGTGQTPPATEATAWIQYDDGTQEAWGPAYTGGETIGNKFTSSWGTFYCDQASAYMAISDTYGFYLTGYTALSGSTLQNAQDDWFTIATTYVTTTGWFLVDGSVTPYSFLGNTTFVFNNTAWIGAYDSADVGLDTSGTDHHGFSVTTWQGLGYVEGAYNAMIRARFNGDGVPVELMGFTVE